MNHSLAVDRRPASALPLARVGRLAIRYNFLWALIGNLFAGAAQVGILCLLAKWCSAHTVGQYALALALISPVFALCSLQLRLIQASDAEQRRSFGTYLAVRLATNGLALAAAIALVAFNDAGRDIAYIVVALALAKLFFATSDMLYGLMQRCERMDCIAKSQILSGSAQIVVVAVAIYVTQSLVVASVCMAAATMATLILYDLPTARWLLSRTTASNHVGSLSPEWNADRIRELVWFALPPGMMVGVVALTASLPRGFIVHFVDTSAVGVFVALLCPGIVLQQTVMALAQATLPRLSQYYSQRNASAFRRLLFKVLAINGLAGFVGLAASVLLGRDLLSLLFRPEFVVHFDAFMWIMVSSVLNCLVALGNVLTASGRFRTQLAIAVVSLVAMIAACAVLVPPFGLLGAAISLVVVAAVRLTVMTACVAQVMAELSVRSVPNTEYEIRNAA